MNTVYVNAFCKTVPFWCLFSYECTLQWKRCLFETANQLQNNQCVVLGRVAASCKIYRGRWTHTRLGQKMDKGWPCIYYSFTNLNILWTVLEFQYPFRVLSISYSWLKALINKYSWREGRARPLSLSLPLPPSSSLVKTSTLLQLSLALQRRHGCARGVQRFISDNNISGRFARCVCLVSFFVIWLAVGCANEWCAFRVWRVKCE